MALTFELDLDILPLDLHTEIQVCMSIRLAVRVRRTHTHTHTHRHTDDVKTITPDTSQCDVGCNKSWVIERSNHREFHVTFDAFPKTHLKNLEKYTSNKKLTSAYT